MAAVSTMGPGGAPMKQAYGSFANKPQPATVYSVMGPGGAPMRSPYGSFAGKPASPVATTVHDHPFLATVGRLMSIP
jgi:hypothetical protein